MTFNVFKKYIRQIHLWLGLTSGLVVFIVSITGAIYVFEKEINLLLQSGAYKYVEPEDKPFISPLTIKKKAQDFFQNEITSIYAVVYPEGNRGTIIWLRDESRKYTAIVQNPYTGETIHSFPYNLNFWGIILAMHTSLLIPEIGAEIVSISTIIFVILLFSGLILWYPKRRKGVKQRMTIKWTATPKRLNYDLHNVFGFYTIWVSIFVALSGLIMAYEWLDHSVYWLASGGESPKENVRVISDISSISKESDLLAEESISKLLSEYQDLDNYLLEFAIDSTDNYLLTLNTNEGFIYNRHDDYVIDQYTGKTLQADLWQNKNNGDKVQEANLNIHIGAILGLPGKFIAFFASLVCASLPITGFYIWWGRKKKKVKQDIE